MPHSTQSQNQSFHRAFSSRWYQLFHAQNRITTPMTPDSSPIYLEVFPQTPSTCGAHLNDTEKTMHLKYTSLGVKAAAKIRL